MIEVNRLVAIEIKPPVDLFAMEGLRFLLRHPDEHNAVAYPSAAPDRLAISSFLSLCWNW